MSVIALASAKGSPGVTMTALALASAWPRNPEPPALVDLDPAAGDVAWRCRGTDGAPLDVDRGLLALGAAARRGAAETSLADHLQPTSLGFSVLTGLPSPEQLSGLGSLWTQLPSLLSRHCAESGADVLVDLGRVVPGSVVLPVLQSADAVVLAVRPDLEGVAQLRVRLRALAGLLELERRGAKPVGVVAVTGYRDTGVVADLQKVIDVEGFAVRVLGIVADDDKGARVLSAGRAGNPLRTLLGRSATGLVEPIRQLADLEPAEVF
ncbi:P-loop NTPase family protein [Nocardioides acrostichi]|uniref:Uncharacterized protein n=1 Tax=Nocardioides acrostichi TaxID=2784339 RepID=A0A930YCT5_9ACTN|nr:hypothetical protein [Nocardioides acrostichi]MBF4161769.1 hypothetical protein [Nocardioides acrostichi]